MSSPQTGSSENQPHPVITHWLGGPCHPGRNDHCFQRNPRRWERECARERGHTEIRHRTQPLKWEDESNHTREREPWPRHTEKVNTPSPVHVLSRNHCQASPRARHLLAAATGHCHYQPSEWAGMMFVPETEPGDSPHAGPEPHQCLRRDSELSSGLLHKCRHASGAGQRMQNNEPQIGENAE